MADIASASTSSLLVMIGCSAEEGCRRGGIMSEVQLPATPSHRHRLFLLKEAVLGAQIKDEHAPASCNRLLD